MYNWLMKHQNKLLVIFYVLLAFGIIYFGRLKYLF